MANHIHVVLSAPAETSASKLLGDLKAYASRRLNRQHGSDLKWWTERGSTRVLPDDRAVSAASDYVAHQVNPLVLWLADSTGSESG
jgi:REP element-mobilizing transposase RayT